MVLYMFVLNVCFAHRSIRTPLGTTTTTTITITIINTNNDNSNDNNHDYRAQRNWSGFWEKAG